MRHLSSIARVMAIASLVAAGCAAQGAPALRSILKGASSNIDSPRQAVARTQAEWSALWKAHDFDQPEPRVDFSREMVVAVFMGGRPTAGFAVEITSVADGVVTYRETVPAAGGITAQVLTAPFHIVAVPKQAGTLKFSKS